jgi:hypothetical protein
MSAQEECEIGIQEGCASVFPFSQPNGRYLYPFSGCFSRHVFRLLYFNPPGTRRILMKFHFFLYVAVRLAVAVLGRPRRA